MEVVPFNELAQIKKYRRLLIDVYLSAYAEIPEYAYTSRRDIWHYLNWLFRRSRGGFFAVFCDGHLGGFISADPEWFDLDQTKVGEIHELAISREYQGKGVGSVLLARAISFLAQYGHRRVGLWVGVNNHRAIEFYRRKGFVPGPVKGIWQRMYLDLSQVAQ